MDEARRKEEWANVNRVMEMVKQEGDATCERAFDFLLAEVAALREELYAHAWTARTYRAKYDRLRETLDDPDKRHWKQEWEQQWARADAAESALRALQAAPTPPSIPMLLWCPECGKRHIDEAEFAEKVHHAHACQFCGMVWRPAVEPTTGVYFLPGFKNAPASGEVAEPAPRKQVL